MVWGEEHSRTHCNESSRYLAPSSFTDTWLPQALCTCHQITLMIHRLDATFHSATAVLTGHTQRLHMSSSAPEGTPPACIRGGSSTPHCRNTTEPDSGVRQNSSAPLSLSQHSSDHPGSPPSGRMPTAQQPLQRPRQQGVRGTAGAAAQTSTLAKGHLMQGGFFNYNNVGAASIGGHLEVRLALLPFGLGGHHRGGPVAEATARSSLGKGIRRAGALVSGSSPNDGGGADDVVSALSFRLPLYASYRGVRHVPRPQNRSSSQ